MRAFITQPEIDINIGFPITVDLYQLPVKLYIKFQAV